MAREALKALSRRPITLSEVFALFVALDSESDRAFAILACTTVEDALESAIKARLVDGLSNEDTSRLFEGDNPLSTFSALIKIGFAMGVYGPVARADMNCLRDIRNAFAHAKMPITFDTP